MPYPDNLTATIEGILVVAGSVWLVGLAERRLNGAGRRATGWARSAFGAFVMESPALMAFASAAPVLDAPAEIKAPLVGATGITVCFWLGRHLPFLSGPGRRHARSQQRGREHQLALIP